MANSTFVGSNATLRTHPRWEDITVDNNLHGACHFGVGIEVVALEDDPLSRSTSMPPPIRRLGTTRGVAPDDDDEEELEEFEAIIVPSPTSVVVDAFRSPPRPDDTTSAVDFGMPSSSAITYAFPPPNIASSSAREYPTRDTPVA